ncbi:interleukin-6 receptor subunit beta-like isoform X3 [Cyprinus carpio]|uniref:Interleukin-6 receptor subunit beta-like isoform X3 n=1 Tax=Cyprinus carpio TaxID=7962 RepID=A0A9Q9V5V7_CYPCA|nr:interleukin-6 receptor subunit beta-like isoform X3 [Cyprinus carpio]
MSAFGRARNSETDHHITAESDPLPTLCHQHLRTLKGCKYWKEIISLLLQLHPAQQQTVFKSEMSQMKLPKTGLVLWMCVMNRVLDTAAAASAASAALSITQCVIMQYTSITCYWETTDHHLNISSYTLQINKTSCESKHSFIPVGSCNTSGSDCSVQAIKSALHCFCADVLASTHTGSIRSPLYFFSGVNAVKLPPPQIKDLRPSARRSGCLQVIWRMAESFPKNEKVYILLQMEYTTHNQTRSQTIQAFSNETLELCDLHPGSKYTVRLRAQDSRAHAHWSSWNSTDTTTAEKAPSAAPRLWRLIQPAEEAGKRRLTLLWKPVSWPEVNGVVLSYSASCHSNLGSSQWTCGAVNASRRSCVLTVSDDTCHCSLTATNSAGTSPPAHISIPAHTHAELPPAQILSVTPLDNTQIKVEWTAALNQSESGFVVQWTSVPYIKPTSLHWEHMNENARSFILTGLLPEVPYKLSVVSLYGQQTGSGMSVIAFTREGVPSVGPDMTVLKTSSSGVVLKWDPVPLEKLHGFIQNYTVLYSINGKDKSVKVDAHVEQITLSELTEGTYKICVMAHTAVGGATGPCQMVLVGLDDVQVIPILLCALLLCFLILIIPVCLRVRIKQCLCPTVPDPSKSSLSVWSKTKLCQHKLPSSSTMSSIISVGQTTIYQDCGEIDYVPVQVLTYHTPHASNEPEAMTYNSTAVTHQDSKLTPAQAFPTHFLIQSYTKPDQVIPAGYKEDPQPSSDDLLFESLFSCKSNQADLCGYIHVSQSYAPVIMTVNAYRTLDPEVLPEDTSTTMVHCSVNNES